MNYIFNGFNISYIWTISMYTIHRGKKTNDKRNRIPINVGLIFFFAVFFLFRATEHNGKGFSIRRIKSRRIVEYGISWRVLLCYVVLDISKDESILYQISQFLRIDIHLFTFFRYGYFHQLWNIPIEKTFQLKMGLVCRLIELIFATIFQWTQNVIVFCNLSTILTVKTDKMKSRL